MPTDFSGLRGSVKFLIQYGNSDTGQQQEKIPKVREFHQRVSDPRNDRSVIERGMALWALGQWLRLEFRDLRGSQTL
jgi:hypothetical protein